MNYNFKLYLDKIEDELKSALPLLPEQQWKNDSFGQLSPVVTAVHLSPLISPTRTLVNLGGKRWRPLLLVLCAEAEAEARFLEKKISKEEMELCVQKAYHLTPLVEFVHTASLIHDDIEDSSDMRRGAPAAYITYGTDTAINAGSWLYFEAPVCIDNSKCTEEQKGKLYAAYTMELRRLHLGQAMDIAWHRDNNARPTAEEYLAMVRCKTGTLASLAARIGMLASKSTSSNADTASRIAADIGAGFQIIDDVTNLTTGNPGKKRGDDIVETKKSLPVLLFAKKYFNNEEKCAELKRCFEVARKDGIDSPAVEKAISLLEESGVIAAAKEKGISLVENGCLEFKNLFGENNKAAEKISCLFKNMIEPKDEKENHLEKGGQNV